MPPRGGGFLARFGRAITSVAEEFIERVKSIRHTISGPEDSAPERTSRPSTPKRHSSRREQYLPAPRDSGPRDAPTVETYRATDIDWGDHGPYPRNWGPEERALWDSEPNTVRDLYGAGEWREAQEAFHYGWLATDMSREDHEEWREHFYDITGMTAASFDWDALREYWEAHGSASINA